MNVRNRYWQGKVMDSKIGVLIVDDSALVRQLLTDMVNKEPDMEVAGIAQDGVQAIKMAQELNPDVITMDIHMPEMDGLSALEYIMRKAPTPVIMISALVQKGAVPTLKALELGAVDFIPKPSQFPTAVKEIHEEVVQKIRAAAGSRARELWDRMAKARRPREAKKLRRTPVGGRLVVIGASAGGPSALTEILPLFPEDMPAPMVIVQHMPKPFTDSFAERLNARSQIQVIVPPDGTELTEGCAFVVPGAHDMVFEKDGASVKVRNIPTVARRAASPVIDVTMESAAQVYGSRSIGVLLTGMGSDGALGLGMIKDAHGDTIAQDEKTSLVFGMPRAAIERKLAKKILPLEKIADGVLALL